MVKSKPRNTLTECTERKQTHENHSLSIFVFFVIEKMTQVKKESLKPKKGGYRRPFYYR